MKWKKYILGANSIVIITNFEKKCYFKQLQYSFWIVLETISKEQVGVKVKVGLTPRCLQNVFNAAEKS